MASSSSSLPDLRASASSRPRMVRDLSLKGTAGHAQRRAAPVQTFNRAERWPRPGHDDLTPRKLAGPEVASARTGPAFTIGKSKVRELRDADEGQPRKLAEPHDSSVVLHKMSRAPAFSIGKGGREVAAKMLSKHSSAPSMLGAARLHHPAVPSMAEIRRFNAAPFNVQC